MKKFEDFLKDKNLEGEWQKYSATPEAVQPPPANPKGWNLGHDESLRDIQDVIHHCIDQTRKVNNFGIEDMQFELINKEETSGGLLLNLEAKGTAHARNAEHIKKHLERLMQMAKAPLAQKGIRMEVMYNRIDVKAAVEEANLDEPAIGLVRKMEFTAIMTAVVNTAAHKKGASQQVSF